MTSPMSIDIPHSLGAAEAKRRIEGGTGRLASFLPPGARVQPHWAGDRLELAVSAMGQDIRAALDVKDTVVRVELVLPPALAFFGGAIEKGVKRAGAELLEDKRTPR